MRRVSSTFCICKDVPRLGKPRMLGNTFRSLCNSVATTHPSWNHAITNASACGHSMRSITTSISAIRSYCSSNASVPSDASKATSDPASFLLNRDVVLQRVIDVVKNFEKVDSSKVTESSHFQNDLGLDSLDVVEVVMALEQEFVLDIPDHDAERIQSIPDAVQYITTNPTAK